MVRVCVLKIQSASPRVEGWDWGSPSNALTWLGEDFHLAGWWPNPAFGSPAKWCAGSTSELSHTWRCTGELGKMGRLGSNPRKQVPHHCPGVTGADPSGLLPSGVCLELGDTPSLGSWGWGGSPGRTSCPLGLGTALPSPSHLLASVQFGPYNYWMSSAPCTAFLLSFLTPECLLVFVSLGPQTQRLFFTLYLAYRLWELLKEIVVTVKYFQVGQ